MIHVGLDGTMMRMNAEKNGDEVIEEAGWREASCGVVTVRDDDGNRLQSRYIGRLPEGKKEKAYSLCSDSSAFQQNAAEKQAITTRC